MLTTPANDAKETGSMSENERANNKHCFNSASKIHWGHGGREGDNFSVYHFPACPGLRIV